MKNPYSSTLNVHAISRSVLSFSSVHRSNTQPFNSGSGTGICQLNSNFLVIFLNDVQLNYDFAVKKSKLSNIYIYSYHLIYNCPFFRSESKNTQNIPNELTDRKKKHKQGVKKFQSMLHRSECTIECKECSRYFSKCLECNCMIISTTSILILSIRQCNYEVS